MYRYYNPNPKRNIVDDCVIRAICKVTGKDWYTVRIELFLMGLYEADYEWKNYIWGRYLEEIGLKQTLLPNTCPYCYTVKDFCYDYPYGEYLLAIGDHVVAVVDGDYYDTWDSGDEVPVYYWKKVTGEQSEAEENKCILKTIGEII